MMDQKINDTDGRLPEDIRRIIHRVLFAVAAIVVVTLIIIGSHGESDAPLDAEQCAILEDNFEIFSKLISEHDRSWSQWEAVDAEKWAAYDAWQAGDCDR
jgi:hypothetical protein